MAETIGMKTFGNLTVMHRGDNYYGIVIFSGKDDDPHNNVEATERFNAWTDMMFKRYMKAEIIQDYYAAWDRARKHIPNGGEVEEIVRDKKGKVACTIRHNEYRTTAEYYNTID